MDDNPALSEAIELLEDISDLEKAKKVRRKSLTIEQYLKSNDIVGIKHMIDAIDEAIYFSESFGTSPALTFL
ncbi:MAG: hypothetical protein ABR980_05955 [Ignavibacteriaceae bacterium]